jgi:hypothetical protein
LTYWSGIIQPCAFVKRKKGTKGGPPAPPFETVLIFRVAAPLRFLEGAEGLVLSLD